MPFQIYAAGQRLTAGGLNSALMIGATVFRAYRGTSQNITTGTETAANALQWDAIDRDLLGAWSSGTPTRWTCPIAGWWTLTGSISLNGSTGGTVRDACWFVNGALIPAGRARTFAESSIANTPLTVEARSLPIQMVVGDYVELVPAHDTGVAPPGLGTATGSSRPYMAITYAGPN